MTSPARELESFAGRHGWRCARRSASRGREAAVAAVAGGDLAARATGAEPGRAEDRGLLRAFALRDYAALLGPEGFGPQVAGMTPRALPGGRTAPARRTSSPLRVETLGACAARRGPTARPGSAPPARAGRWWVGSGIQNAPAEAGGDVGTVVECQHPTGTLPVTKKSHIDPSFGATLLGRMNLKPFDRVVVNI